jgi:taurine dioxygenase
MSVVAERMQIESAAPGSIGAEVTGVDVRDLAADDPEVQQLRDEIYRSRLVTIRGQKLSEQEYVDFARKMGTPQVYFQKNYHHPDYPEIFVSSNVKDGEKKVGVARTGHYWHTDCSFQEKPLSWTSIHPQVFSQARRGTMYIDMVKVYRELPDELRRYVDGVTAVHAGQLRYKIQACDIDKSLKELLDWVPTIAPPVRHPAVIEHPKTGEKVLYLNSGFTVQLEGIAYEENQKRLAALFEFIEREEHVFYHYWEPGDLILWDNRFLIHKSTAVPAGELSKSYRIGIYDGLPYYKGLTP